MESGDRAHTDDQLNALDALKGLDPEGAVTPAMQEFVRECPRGRAHSLARALATYCERYDKPLARLSHAVREGYAMSEAEAIALARESRSGDGGSWEQVRAEFGDRRKLDAAEDRRRLNVQRRFLENRRQGDRTVPEWTPALAWECWSQDRKYNPERYS